MGGKKRRGKKVTLVTFVWKSCDSTSFGIKINAASLFDEHSKNESSNLHPAVNSRRGCGIIDFNTVLADHVINRFGKLIRSTAKAIVHVAH